MKRLLAFFLFIPHVVFAAELVHAPDCQGDCGKEALRLLWRSAGEASCCHQTAFEIQQTDGTTKQNGYFYKHRGPLNENEMKAIFTEYLTHAAARALEVEEYIAGKPKFMKTCQDTLYQRTTFIPGEDLYDVSERNPASRASEDSYAANFLLTLVCRPGDSKARNMRVVSDNHLKSIDHEMYMDENPAILDPQYAQDELHEGVCKSVLFHLPNFHQQVPTRIIDYLLNVGKDKQAWEVKVNALEQKYQRKYIKVMRLFKNDEDIPQALEVIAPQRRDFLDATIKGIGIMGNVGNMIPLIPLMKPGFNFDNLKSHMTYHFLLCLLATSSKFHAVTGTHTHDNYKSEAVMPYTLCSECPQEISDIKVIVGILRNIPELAGMFVKTGVDPQNALEFSARKPSTQDKVDPNLQSHNKENNERVSQ